MGREETTATILSSNAKNILAELPTSFGKSKIALEWLKDKPGTTLIVVPRLVLIDNWIAEMEKWGCRSEVTFTTYVSLHKHAGNWTNIIFDECHHLSDRCFEVLKAYIPLELDNVAPTHVIVKNKGKGTPIVVSYKDSKKYIGVKYREINILCTQQEYYNDLCNLIRYYKNKAGISRTFKNLWLHKCGERLKWLSQQKTAVGSHLLSHFLQGTRTLTFCHSIEQTEVLGKHCINSANKNALKELEAFNNGKVEHITACAMLDEGVNLKNCKAGLFINLNASERMQKQRLGRLLRHPEPIIIIPYFKDTRDEEILEKMLLDYNKNLITIIEPSKLGIRQ